MDYHPKTSVRNLSLLLQKVSVLVVDPDPRIANIVKHVLLNLGFGTLHIVHSFTEGREIIKTKQVDFVITDYDGDQLAEGEQSFIEFIRTSPDSPNPYVPIIMVTGHTDFTEVQAARDMGITEFAAKPFTAKSLTDRIVRIIENPRSFIITKRYTGPDRRHRDLAPPAVGDRRKADLSAPDSENAENADKSGGLFQRLFKKDNPTP